MKTTISKTEDKQIDRQTDRDTKVSIEFISDGTTTWIYGEKKETLEKQREILEIKNQCPNFYVLHKTIGYIICYCIFDYIICDYLIDCIIVIVVLYE